MLLPDAVPETVPDPLVPVLLSVIVIVPENDVDDCVRTQVIRPAPDESVAVPDHEPPTLAVVEEGGGDEEGAVEDPLPPPLQAVAASATMSAAATALEVRMRIILNWADSSMAEFGRLAAGNHG